MKDAVRRMREYPPKAPWILLVFMIPLMMMWPLTGYWGFALGALLAGVPGFLLVWHAEALSAERRAWSEEAARTALAAMARAKTEDEECTESTAHPESVLRWGFDNERG